MAPLILGNRRKLVDTSKHPGKKRAAICVTLIWFGVIFYYQSHLLAAIAMWTIFLQNVQLFVALPNEVLKG